METQSRVLKWSLIIGIVIVLNLFFNYTLSLVYKNPVFENFCPANQVNEIITTSKACVAQGGQWNESNFVPTPVNLNQKTPTPQGYCNLQFTCQNNYNAAQKAYDRNVFITLVILGALCVAVGTFLKSNMVVGVALSLAGVFSFIIASMRYWSSAEDLIKVVILGIALAILIWVAIKKFRNIEQVSQNQ